MYVGVLCSVICCWVPKFVGVFGGVGVGGAAGSAHKSLVEGVLRSVGWLAGSAH